MERMGDFFGKATPSMTRQFGIHVNNNKTEGPNIKKNGESWRHRSCSVVSTDSGIGDCETSENVVDSVTGLKIISLDEVADHCTREDGWLVLFDKVYDVTEFLRSHPGGEEVVMEYLGCDATLAFRGVTGHTSGVIARYLQNFIVGILPDYERLGLTCG